MATWGPWAPAAAASTVLAAAATVAVAAGDGLVGLSGGGLSPATVASKLWIAVFAAEASAGGPAGTGLPVDALELDSLTSFTPRERFFAEGLASDELPGGCLLVMPSRWLLKSATAGGLAPSDVTPVSETVDARLVGEPFPAALPAVAI
ncbi:MAG: hypothetical protein ACP5P1_09080 [Acidimicrobiales bacterium]